jgi:hypothetical protein
MTTGHPPGPDGEREALAFLEQSRQKLAAQAGNNPDTDLQAWTGLCRVLLVSNAAMHIE